ncbi:LacI family DNA-binding transcriptional regulator [Acidisoma cellulosilytica]|uniref:LacI family DNA-binding transcriptional regulator n=1 Tax=Acidisoma cellulosilyticum TaxID=2802395 RepID=A0A963Z2L8_9PROT|nr:LacI family DNA-binding transcriptional regulator [Acidisoma cellulosilyticum]MCB8881394.1 LacI family DNA-binding transcriptional regulator [Acidisoma cellulosilyticum]
MDQVTRPKHAVPQPRVTSFDVAALAGVSQSSVSRAFSKRSNISEDTRQKIFEAARKLNYVPNSIASSLTTRRSNIIALIIGDLKNPFYVRMLHAFSERLQAEGRQILAFTAGPDDDTDAVMMRVLQYQVDGIIVTQARLSMRMTGLSHERGIPIIFFNRYVPGSDASCVRCDNAAGGRVLAECLLRAGAKSFAMIAGEARATTSHDRISGFVERLRESGVRPQDIETAEGFSTYDGGVIAIQKLLKDRKAPLPDALFCINDIMAMGAMDVMTHSYGLSVPTDIMVASFDNIPESGRLPYQLTTIEQPLDAMITETLKLLHLDDPGSGIELGLDRPIPGPLIWRATIPGSAPDAATLATL